MTGLPTANVIETAEYAAIEATIAASERGRWFLAEHGRRARAEETRTVLDAIARLEQTVTAERIPAPGHDLRRGLLEMAEVIDRTRAEVAPGTRGLDAIVQAAEQATADILAAAEAVQEAAWTLRERQVGGEIPGGEAGDGETLVGETCGALDRHATAIYTACSFHDLAGRRMARIIDTLCDLEDRIGALVALRVGGQGRPPSAGEAARFDGERYATLGVPPVTAAAIGARPGSLTLHEDIVFVPVATLAAATADAHDPAPPVPAAPETAAPETAAPETMAAETAPSAEPAPSVQEPAAPEDDEPAFDFDLDAPPAMTLAGLDALPAQDRLALFA